MEEEPGKVSQWIRTGDVEVSMVVAGEWGSGSGCPLNVEGASGVELEGVGVCHE